ncbi:MAG: ATP-dependent Clp protease ATP-binding subunit [Oscillospiraceae bacterium]|nr:ATP-dependent Clp protease ATP-binding subunit [Oscillospiraceae bacterium]
MFFENRFTSRAEEIIRYARECASGFGNGVVEGEHLLLALAHNKGGRCASALKKAGVTYDSILFAVSAEGVKKAKKRREEKTLSPGAKRIVREAQKIAEAFGKTEIGEEHLLLGILHEGKNSALVLLRRLGVDERELSRILLGGGEREEELRRTEGTKGTKAAGELKMLRNFGRDMCALAKEGRLDPVIGRDAELRKMICILSRRSKNNPILLGDAGVGKTALVEGLAERIAKGDVPQNLACKKIYSVDISAVVAGTKYRGEFEERIKTMFAEVARAGDIILFIDEIHTIVGAGAAEGAIDAANILKPALSRREIQIIGATTGGEYRKYIEKDAAMARRFRTVAVEEPNEAECVRIIKGLAPKYAAHHGCEISDEAIESAVALSKRYINERRLPDKAIDLIDEALSRKRMEAAAPPPDMKRLEEMLSDAVMQKRIAIRDENFPRAAEMKSREAEISARLFEEKEKWQKILEGKESIVGEDVALAVSEQSGIPVFRITRSERERLLNLGEELSAKVVGQERAVAAVARAIRRARALPQDDKRPHGSFLFAGPTGVGKTRLCTALAECMFDGRDKLIRLDMSEYMEKHTVAKLLGAPPGYVGFDAGETLVDKVRKKPYSVVLFDEIEKAHPDIFNVLLQILEDGKLTDSGGKSADFSNTVIIMTSNIGADKMAGSPVGFLADSACEEEVRRRAVESEIKKIIRPELLGRIDEIIVFKNLETEELRKILDGMIEKLILRAEKAGVRLVVEESARETLVEKCKKTPYGARSLRKLILTELEDGLSKFCLEENGALLRAFSEGEKLKIEKEESFLVNKG